jgi:hypothetical protein
MTKGIVLAVFLSSLCGRDAAAQDPGEDFSVACGAADLLANANFTTNLAFWDTTAGAAWSPEDASGSSTSGSAQLQASGLASTVISQCVSVRGGERYLLEAYILFAAQNGAQGEAGIDARWYAGTNCTDELPDSPASILVDSSPDWTRQSLSPTTPVPAKSARIELRATDTGSTEGTTFTANLDLPIFFLLGAPSCGDIICSFSGPSASDARAILEAAVGWFDRNPCYCDVDGSGVITAIDALADLKASVDSTMPLACPACE